ncbi:unnamed protein product [Adineta ricciae]|uniref:Uncharacterized protein n=1 Tax=Adineta ricciae TaxID=249248 RepID=A0A813VK30_ADIRI|nr:unnamed protein product [Adineta ricciae]
MKKITYQSSSQNLSTCFPIDLFAHPFLFTTIYLNINAFDVKLQLLVACSSLNNNSRMARSTVCEDASTSRFLL